MYAHVYVPLAPLCRQQTLILATKNTVTYYARTKVRSGIILLCQNESKTSSYCSHEFQNCIRSLSRTLIAVKLASTSLRVLEVAVDCRCSLLVLFFIPSRLSSNFSHCMSDIQPLSSSLTQAMADPLSSDYDSQNVFHEIYTRSRAAANICLHLFIYNYAMLAMTTSLPRFIMPRILDFSIEVPHVISIIFPMTAAFIAYLSASFIFAHVNIYMEKQLIPISSLSKRTRTAYPMLAGIIMLAVVKEVVDNLGTRHAWIWTLRLAACCIAEAIFLYVLVNICFMLFPKFREGAGPLVEDLIPTDDDIV